MSITDLTQGQMIDGPAARIAGAIETPEHQVLYVDLPRPTWEHVRSVLGHEMHHGTCKRGPYMQELHVRYVVEQSTTDLTPSDNRST